jgi:glycosyltransferase involved in cell wall biosynthesis
LPSNDVLNPVTHTAVVQMRICFWGTYDTGKPRVRILLDGLRSSGHDVTEIHTDPWRKIADKSQIRSAWTLIPILLGIFISYPFLLARHAWSRRNDVVICAYPGNLDILVLWPLAKLRREKVALDAFLPLYDTVVEDRALLSARDVPARLLHLFERVSCHAADFVLTDTNAHGDYFAKEFALPRRRILRAFVGHEPRLFHRSESRKEVGAGPVVLFYGQFIPLHGMLTVFEAAKLSAATGVRWKIIGTGQEEKLFAAKLRDSPIPHLEWVTWVDYEMLLHEIQAADVCLGIFGTSEKAGRVIPNKVFQIIASGKRLITRDSPAIREILTTPSPAFKLVPAGDPTALLDAILQSVGEAGEIYYEPNVLQSITPQHIGRALAEQLEEGLGN